MKVAQCFIFLGIILLLGACEFGPKIEIGDYDKQLEAWNKQNMLDYQFLVKNGSRRATITVRNGIPVHCDDPEWFANGKMSTIPEFFSFIKEEEKKLRKSHDSMMLTVYYDTYFHYPENITLWPRRNESGPVWRWRITQFLPLGPSEEEE